MSTEWQPARRSQGNRWRRHANGTDVEVELRRKLKPSDTIVVDGIVEHLLDDGVIFFRSNNAPVHRSRSKGDVPVVWAARSKLGKPLTKLKRITGDVMDFREACFAPLTPAGTQSEAFGLPAHDTGWKIGRITRLYHGIANDWRVHPSDASCIQMRLRSADGTIKGITEFDARHHRRVAAITWYLHSGYAASNDYTSGRMVFLHQFILKAEGIVRPEGADFVDHRDRNRLNNRAANLRYCTDLKNKNNYKVPKFVRKRRNKDGTIQYRAAVRSVNGMKIKALFTASPDDPTAEARALREARAWATPIWQQRVQSVWANEEPSDTLKNLRHRTRESVRKHHQQRRKRKRSEMDE